MTMTENTAVLEPPSVNVEIAIAAPVPPPAAPERGEKQLSEEMIRTLRDGEVDLQLLERESLFLCEWAAIRRRWKARIAADYTRREVLPKAEAAVADLERQAAECEGNLKGDRTLDEWRRIFSEIPRSVPPGMAAVPELPLATATDLSQAFALYAQYGQVLRAKAIRQKMENDAARRNAQQVLSQSAKHVPLTYIRSIENQIASAKRRIESRRAILEAEQHAQELRETIGQLVRGEATPPREDGVFFAADTADAQLARQRAFLAQCKAKLAGLLAMATKKDEALAANRADEEEIARLSQGLVEETERRKQTLYALENMSWALPK